MEWTCVVCGFRYDERARGPIPPDFICPLCGADLRAFAPSLQQDHPKG